MLYGDWGHLRSFRTVAGMWDKGGKSANISQGDETLAAILTVSQPLTVTFSNFLILGPSCYRSQRN